MKHRFLGLGIAFLWLGVGHALGAVRQDTSSVEWIKVYFNMPADHSVALPGNKSNDEADVIGSLEALIDSAESSIDLCIYDLEQPRIGRALVRAKKRGLQVRLITDNYNRDDSHEVDSLMWAMLRKGGVISIDDDGDVYMPDGTIFNNSLVNAGADMHNKFAVIDALDDDPDNDYVWTGSTNLTYTGAFNTNHTVVIKDDGIARSFTSEFEQMWGSSSDLPNLERARFHKDKKEHGPHVFYVDDTRVELYFAPINRTHTKPSIAHRLAEVTRQEAQHDIMFQAFAISAHFPLSRVMWQLSSTGKVELHGVIDHLFYARYEHNGTMWASPEAKIANRLILPSHELRKLHNKVVLIDAANPDSSDQAVVFTGSYNFSNNADKNNDENSLIIYSDTLANQFYQDFMGVAERAKERSWPPAPPIETTKWYAVSGDVDAGSRFSINVVPGFQYDVRFLGVKVPAVYAGHDSSDYNAGMARQYLKELLDGAEVKLSGPYGSEPDARYGAFQAYVTRRRNGDRIAVNSQLLKEGIGQYVPYYSQHPDSVDRFETYEQQARSAEKGIWKQPSKIGQKVSRSKALGNSTTTLANIMPININTADAELLQLLPGVGPAYAKRIISYRNAHNGFSSVDQLQDVKGIGPKTLAKLRPNVVAHK